MKKKYNLLFDYSVDRKNNTILVRREFKSSLALVWKAWSTASLLDQWWGPKPWKAVTKTMDFREGGYWLYAMVSPEGEKHWSRVDYITIMFENYIKMKDGFCDADGILNPDFPQNYWESTFSVRDSIVTIECVLTFNKLEDLEITVSMGFREGFATGLNQLEELLDVM